MVFFRVRIFLVGNLAIGGVLMPYPRGAAPSPSLGTLVVRPIKRAIAAEVVALFNDRSRGENRSLAGPTEFWVRVPSLGGFMAM